MAYALGPRAVVARSRALAVWGAAAVAAPAWLVVVLVAQLGLASCRALALVATLIGAIAVVRAIAEYGRARRRLAALAVDAQADALVVRTARGTTRVPRTAITRAIEIDGPLGGVRLLLRGHDLPRRLDVPRGGDEFGELCARIAAWVPIDRARRRGAIARVALGLAIVAGLFFLPFVVADARGSRVAVLVVLVGAWMAMRFATSRR